MSIEELDEYSQYLQKCRGISILYLDMVLRYKRELTRDRELAAESRKKMRPLLDRLSARIDEFLNAIAVELEVIKRGKEWHREIIAEEFIMIANYFERLSSTTTQLRESKRKIEAKIKSDSKLSFRQRIQAPSYIPATTTKARRPQTSISINLNENWLNSIQSDASHTEDKPSFSKKSCSQSTKKQHSGSTTAPKQLLSAEDMTKYLAWFHTIQSEFGQLKEEIRALKEEPHKHASIETELFIICASTVKIGGNNKIILREHADLIHDLHLMCKSRHLFIG